MVKGYNGETQAEAMKKAIGLLGNHSSAQNIFDKVREMGSWSDGNIWQGLMSRLVNLPPSYKHWRGIKAEQRFLFLREDGDYEFYQPAKHGRYQQGRKVV